MDEREDQVYMHAESGATPFTGKRATTISGCDECAALAAQGVVYIVGRIRCPHGHNVTGSQVFDPAWSVRGKLPFYYGDGDEWRLI